MCGRGLLIFGNMQQWTVYRLTLAFVMLITGSANTLFGKWADQQDVKGTPGYGVRTFNHPFFQAVCMFVGEMLCGVVFLIILLIRKKQGHDIGAALGHVTFDVKKIFTERGALARSFLVFFPPAMCDITGTSVMFIGLNYTTASSFQMLRGAVIIFTALLSVTFLRREITWTMWTGIGVVLIGLITVGLSDVIFNPSTLPLAEVITGDELILMAQIVVACQMVYEERFVTKLDVNPLLAVGLEGVYGFTVLSLLCIPFYFIHVGPQFSNSPEYRLEDVLDAFAMMANSWQVTAALSGLVFSIAFFNWSGISVTKELSATTRMVLDSCRTVVIWAASLALQWQFFEWLQLIGFIVLTVGIFIYNDILNWRVAKKAATCKYCRKNSSDDMEVLIEDGATNPSGMAIVETDDDKHGW